MKALRTSWKHLRRSPYQALAAIFIMMQTFFVITIFSFVIYGSAQLIKYFESKPQVTAFFKDEAQPENINALADTLKTSGKVATIRYVSKKEALQIYKQQFKDDPLLLDLVTEGILPASLEISAINIEDLVTISDSLKNSPLVQQVIFPRDVIETLSSITSALRKVGMAIIAVLAVDAIFIMVIIIGIKISQKKEEIEIMRLLSATNWYIRWPFLFEGVFYGVIGAIIGWSLASAVLLYTLPVLRSFFGSVPVLQVHPIYLLGLLGGEIIVATILGVFSSFLAVLRYLK
ncbi:MAG: FtsX-like permease family protein [Candidatus Levybacteria bacterium]|nr:FtsX-like permease family protein [Candidatus Levybacteria bacterium]